MSRSVGTLLCALLWAYASTVLASAQAASSPSDESAHASSSPAAYVYVSSYISSGKTSLISGYVAASNGSLTAISGSPFKYNVAALALNGAWLFGVDSTDTKIKSFAIDSNGSLAVKDTYTNSTGAGLYDLFLDHTGATLYSDHYTINNDYLSLSIDQATGQLAFIEDIEGGPSNNSEMSFIGNNRFAYSSSCYHFTPDIFGVRRASDGALSWLDINPPFPAEKSGGFYCAWLAAADPTNHLAVAMQPLNSNWGNDGPWQLAVYTADSSGNLTTASTYENMPRVLVGAVNNYWMSPDGKYLAVSGASGLQVFRFNGANPITRLTALIATGGVQQVYWDNLDHLYAVSAFNTQQGKLYVFTVTSKGATQAPGSPHRISSPQSLIVLPK
jgi:hypothetical protein